MRKKHERRKYKLKVFKSIEDAFEEIADIKAGRRKKGRTLREFLDEV